MTAPDPAADRGTDGIDRVAYPKLAKYAEGIIALAPFQKALAGEAAVAEQMGLDRRFLS